MSDIELTPIVRSVEARVCDNPGGPSHEDMEVVILDHPEQNQYELFPLTYFENVSYFMLRISAHPIYGSLASTPDAINEFGVLIL